MTTLHLVHTADLHLGRAFREMGERGSLLRDRIKKALENTVEIAVDRRASALLVAGDLFESPYPCGKAMDDLVAAVKKLSAADIKTIVLPGTHDPHGSRVYNHPLFHETHGVSLLTPAGPSVVFVDLGLAVAGWFPPLEGAGKWTGPEEGWHENMDFRVAMAHGSVLSGLDGKVDDAVPAEILEDTSINYLALGHHHGCREIKEARATSFYSGSPEVLAVDQAGAGHVVCVTMSRNNDGVSVEAEPVRAGSLRIETMEVDAGEILAGRDLRAELLEKADPDLIADVVVGGRLPVGASFPDLEDMEQELSSSFFRLRVKDLTRVITDAGEMGDAPEASVLYEFTTRMKERIENSKDPERGEWEDALKLGLHFLSGADREK